jgi:hypothetical protein
MPKREKLTLKRASFSLFGIEQTRKVVVLSKEQYPQNKWIFEIIILLLQNTNNGD